MNPKQILNDLETTGRVYDFNREREIEDAQAKYRALKVSGVANLPGEVRMLLDLQARIVEGAQGTVSAEDLLAYHAFKERLGVCGRLHTRYK